jgi:class 3 adenylate cyclase
MKRLREACGLPLGQTIKPALEAVSSHVSVRNLERRQVSILFCDMVDSVGLSSRYSLEDYGALMLIYREICILAVLAAGGMVVQYSGDGMLACFGYPVAHQDDPVRAVRAGFGILKAVRDLNSHLAANGGPTLAVRAAVHMDTVLICDFDIGLVHEPMVIGEGPNIAGRLQKIAEPNTLVVSAAVFYAVKGFYKGRSVGPCSIRGLSRMLDVFEILHPVAPST